MFKTSFILFFFFFSKPEMINQTTVLLEKFTYMVKRANYKLFTFILSLENMMKRSTQMR